VKEHQEPTSERTFAQVVRRLRNVTLPERVEGEVETAKMPFAEFDKSSRRSSADRKS
jgi:hypothetical protein